MSVCKFLAADIPLQEVRPLKDYPVHINIDNGIIDDGGADDNFFLLHKNSAIETEGWIIISKTNNVT